MKRRKLLLGIGVVVSGFSGCLGDLNGEDNGNQNGEDNDIEYERCALTYIPITDLPSPAKEEATTAIKNEVYETDRELALSEVMDIEGSYLTEYNGEWVYYDMAATTEDGATRLRGEEVRPKETGLPSIINQTETDMKVDARVETEGELVLEDTFDLPAGMETDLDRGAAYPYGHYQAILTISTGAETWEQELSWLDDHIRGSGDIVISADGVRMTDGPSAARQECEWNDEGKLVNGPKQS